MVAVSGAGWRLAPCLTSLFAEADARKPSRSHAWDGSVGDLAHRSRVSDHNPSDGWVCAGDVDDDGDSSPVLGVDLLVAHLADTRDPRVKYLIRNGRIWTPDRGWRPYDGLSPHDHHAHVSVWNTATARNDLRPWWPAVAPRPTPAPPLPQELADLAATVITRKSNTKQSIMVPDFTKAPWWMSTDGGITSPAAVELDDSAWSGITALAAAAGWIHKV